MAAISLISIVWKNFQLPTPLKFGSLSFLSVNRNGISVLAIMKKLKNGCHFFNIDCNEKFPITNPPSPPKVWVSSIGHYEKNEKWLSFFNIDQMEKFPITDPPKFGSLIF